MRPWRLKAALQWRYCWSGCHDQHYRDVFIMEISFLSITPLKETWPTAEAFRIMAQSPRGEMSRHR
jgi:hypothetical protein